MKKIISLLTVLFVSLFVVNSFAYTAPPKPENGGYVLDQTGKLSQSQIDQLNQKLEGLNKSTKNEFGAAIIKSTEGEDISEIGQTIFRSWGVGKAGLDNGVLVVIAVAEHKTRIQTGKGVEGDLPDLKCKDILNLVLKPHLKQGEFYEGLDATFNSLSTAVEDRSKAVALPVQPRLDSAVSASSDESHGGLILLLVLGALGAVGVVIVLVNRSNRLRREENERLFEASQERTRVRQEEARKERERRSNLKTTPEVYVPVVPGVTHPGSSHNYAAPIAAGAVAATVVGAAAIAAERAAAAQRRQTEDRESQARRRRDEEDRVQRDNRRRSEESRSSYSSPSYSSYSDSGSSYGGSDSGSGFGGGDSGGGGSSGDY